MSDAGVEESKGDGGPAVRFTSKGRAPTQGGATLQETRLLPALTTAIKATGRHGEEGDAAALSEVRTQLEEGADPFHPMPKSANALGLEASAAFSALLKGHLDALQLIFDMGQKDGTMKAKDVAELQGLFGACETAPKKYRYKKLSGAADRIRGLLESAAEATSTPPAVASGAGSGGGAAPTKHPTGAAGSATSKTATPASSTTDAVSDRPADQFVQAAHNGKVAVMHDIWRDHTRTLTPDVHDASGRTALTAAVFAGKLKCVEFLFDGWDEGKVKMPPANIDAPGSADGTGPVEPALFIALRTQSDDMLRTLLGFGAALDFTNTSGETIRAEDVATEEWQQYWLAAARRLPRQNMVHLRKANMHRLGLINFCLIGQWAAKALVMDALLASVTLYNPREKKPLVILLPGPPGHGKTVLAKCVKRVLGEGTGYKVWPIGTLKAETDLFGAGPMFRGDAPTFLKFHQEYDARRAVAVLDELDKASPELLQALYGPFQEGEITARNLGTKKGEKGNSAQLDCSRMVYIATCNWGQDVITDFVAEHEDDEEMLLCNTDNAIRKLNATLGYAVRQYIIERLAGQHCDALVGRLDVVAPYIPFAKEEQWMLADTMIRRGLKSLEDPPNSGRHIGSVIVKSSRTITDYLVKTFDPREGARSIFNTYSTKVLGAVNAAYMTVSEPALLPGTTAQLRLVRPDGAGEPYIICKVTT